MPEMPAAAEMWTRLGEQQGLAQPGCGHAEGVRSPQGHAECHHCWCHREREQEVGAGCPGSTKGEAESVSHLLPAPDGWRGTVAPPLPLPLPLPHRLPLQCCAVAATPIAEEKMGAKVPQKGAMENSDGVDDRTKTQRLETTKWESPRPDSRHQISVPDHTCSDVLVDEPGNDELSSG